MNHRERVLMALEHKQPDRIPMDLGSCAFSSIVVEVYDKLKQSLGIGEESVIGNKMIQSVHVSEKVMRALDTDFRPVFLSPGEINKEQTISENKYVDIWGVERIKPESSIYFDQYSYPMSGDLSIDGIKKYPWPDPTDPAMYKGLKDRAKALRNAGEYAVVFNPGTVFVHFSQYLRGYEDWYTDLLLDKDLICYLFDTILDISMEICRRALDELGEFIDVFATADDLATQNSLIMSPGVYRELIKPRHKKYFDLVRSKTGAKILFHTCGAVEPIIGDLIDIGVDILNPVQVSAAGMDPVLLKKNYGDKLSFWGGIDTQRILPRGSIQDVENEARRIIDILGKDGGYVLNAVHTIQPDVPVENILAMYRVGKNYIT